MRRVLLTGMMVLILLALGLLWSMRFQRSPNLKSWHLANLRTDFPTTEGVEWQGEGDTMQLRLHTNPGCAPIAIRLALPDIVPVNGLHFKFRIAAQNLVRGSEIWEDGRFMIEWLSKNGGKELERNAVGSIQGDKPGKIESLVILAPDAQSIPVLRLENLARSGDFILSDLEITAVQESGVWKIGRWILAATGMLWAALCIRAWPCTNGWRVFAAAAIWVVFFANLVIPGPWKIQRPLCYDFRLGSVSGPPFSESHKRISIEKALKAASPSSGSVVAVGKLPDQGSILLRVKYAIKRARPLLHVLSLLGPTVLLLLLVGRRPAIFLAVLLACSMELGEVAFGYGFGWDDVMDLITDGIGIGIAVMLWTRIQVARSGPDRTRMKCE